MIIGTWKVLSGHGMTPHRSGLYSILVETEKMPYYLDVLYMDWIVLDRVPQGT